jgi:hypothetical protein
MPLGPTQVPRSGGQPPRRFQSLAFSSQYSFALLLNIKRRTHYSFRWPVILPRDVTLPRGWVPSCLSPHVARPSLGVARAKPEAVGPTDTTNRLRQDAL